MAFSVLWGAAMAQTAEKEAMGGVRRKLPRDARRAELIEATIRVLARKGYARLTTGDVAREAGLSVGLVNFHFNAKENLLVETLLFLAEEYRQNWTAALAVAPPDAPSQLCAMLTADFDPALFTATRLAAWVSFWGEAQSRPLYQERCGANDLEYNLTLETLCRRMIEEHGYSGHAARIARVLRVTIEGTWFDLITLSAPPDMDEARATVLTAAAAFFPRHFDGQGLCRPSPRAEAGRI